MLTSSIYISPSPSSSIGSAIFSRLPDRTLRLLSIGCNLVVPENNSLLHGETVAIQVAQSKLAAFSLRAEGNYELFTSCEPCCMCLGATLWSGVSRIVCGATKEDAGKIGFDEGPVFSESYEHLERAGIEVVRFVGLVGSREEEKRRRGEIRERG